jgi:hypothetical protein
MFDKRQTSLHSDLRKRILFTLGLLFMYRLGGHLPTPGIDTAKLEQFFTGHSGRLATRICRPVLRRPAATPDDFRSGDHAVHCVDHSAIADGGL